MAQSMIATPAPQRTLLDARSARRSVDEPPPPGQALRPGDRRRLIAAEFDVARASMALSDLAGLFHQVSEVVPELGPAALAVRALKRELRALWESVEGEVADALEGRAGL